MFDRVEIAPDSVLLLLSGMDREKMSLCESARYALAYTWALDKIGTNVDDDSLVRLAYNYYKERQSDVLYPRSMYYMGKYYFLADSSEMAMQCFEQAVTGAVQHKDTVTECMALEKFSKLLRHYDIEKAVTVAHEATRKYSVLMNHDIVNQGWLELNECQNVSYGGDYDAAMRLCRKAFSTAKKANDSLLLRDVCNAQSYIYSMAGLHDSACFYAKQAIEYDRLNELSAILNLSYEYICMDSLKEAERLLLEATDSMPVRLYAKYYNLLRISIINGDKDRSLTLLDSTTSYIDGMYQKELEAKDGYYKELMAKEHERAELKGLSEMKTRLIVSFGAFFPAVLLFILYIFYNNRKTARRRAKFSKEKMEIRQKYERRLYEQELANKDLQLSIMRAYLLKRIEVISKIENLKEHSGILLSDDDWQEIRVFLDSVDNLFISRLTEKYPSLSEKDIRLFMLLRLQISSKTIAAIYGISEKSIKQKLYLYKSKVGLEKSDDSLRSFLESF
ncbi:MAG: hypothetical protein NC431_11465 [Firmicutes bacterium]|nr:hypothetical protein [Bacteroidales bacterium]MCM1207253.1 hypothetical protein [Bacillota bacterium]MCM1509496.1 hypothetical protein [Clostridium sp.]